MTTTTTEPRLVIQARLPLTDPVRASTVLEFFRENNIEFQAVVSDTQLAQLLEQLPSPHPAVTADHQPVIDRLTKIEGAVEALSSIILEAVGALSPRTAAPAALTETETETETEPEVQPAPAPVRRGYKIPESVVSAVPLAYDEVSVTVVRTERYGMMLTVAGFSKLLGQDKTSLSYHLSRHKNACRAVKIVVGKARWSWAFRLPETLAYLRSSRASFVIPTDAEAQKTVDGWIKPQAKADPAADEIRKELAPKKPAHSEEVPAQLSTKDWPKNLIERLDYLREQGHPVFYRKAKRGNQVIATINGRTHTIVMRANCLPPAVVKRVNKLLAGHIEG